MNGHRDAQRPEEPIEPDAARPADEVADELFVHGLLSSREYAEGTRQRVAAVMAAIASDDPTAARRRWPWWLLAGAAAALLAVALWPADSPDPAKLWTGALQAAERVGDRHYDVRAAWSGGDIGLDVAGEIDLRDAGNYVFRANVEGARVAIGATAGERWLTGDERLVRHLQAHREGRGPFAMDAAGTVFGSVDALLAVVPTSYRLQHVPAASDGLLHIIAQRMRPGATPARVDAWLDPATGLMRRIDLFWTDDPAAIPSPRQGGQLTGHHHMDLTLTNTSPFPADWFRAERHR